MTALMAALMTTLMAMDCLSANRSNDATLMAIDCPPRSGHLAHRNAALRGLVHSGRHLRRRRAGLRIQCMLAGHGLRRLWPPRTLDDRQQRVLGDPLAGGRLCACRGSAWELSLLEWLCRRGPSALVASAAGPSRPTTSALYDPPTLTAALSLAAARATVAATIGARALLQHVQISFRLLLRRRRTRIRIRKLCIWDRLRRLRATPIPAAALAASSAAAASIAASSVAAAAAALASAVATAPSITASTIAAPSRATPTVTSATLALAAAATLTLAAAAAALATSALATSALGTSALAPTADSIPHKLSRARPQSRRRGQCPRGDRDCIPCPRPRAGRGRLPLSAPMLPPQTVALATALSHAHGRSARYSAPRDTLRAEGREV